MLQAVVWLSVLPARSLLPVTFSDPCSGPRGKQARGALCVWPTGLSSGVPGFPAPLCSYWSSSTQKLNTNVNPHREGGQCLSAVATQFSFLSFPFSCSSPLRICPELASQGVYKTVDLLSLLSVVGTCLFSLPVVLASFLLLNPRLLENT